MFCAQQGTPNWSMISPSGAVRWANGGDQDFPHMSVSGNDRELHAEMILG
jgi:hypothetical protein